MTHYDVDYSKLDGKAKRDKAIADIKDYVGEEKFADVHKSLVEYHKVRPLSYNVLALNLMLTGISGYPVVAWLDLIAEETNVPVKADKGE